MNFKYAVTELFKGPNGTLEQRPLKAFGDIQEAEQYVKERVKQCAVPDADKDFDYDPSTDTLRQAYAVIAVDSFIQWDVFCLVG